MNDETRRSDGSPDRQVEMAFERQIDRLVDGELTADERRQVLAECEERDGAWRRCALAFLEAQAWRSELTALAAPPVSVAAQANPPIVGTTSANQPGANVKRRRWVRLRSPSEDRWSTALGAPWALAACALVAFALGWLARPQSHDDWTENLEPVASSPLAEHVADLSNENLGGGPDEVSSDFAMEEPETVTLVMDCGPNGEQRQIELPVMPAGEEDLASLERGEPVVTAELQAALLRMGYRVQERRQLMPFVLNDGRRVVAPLDEIEFVPVKAPEFQ